MSSVSPLQNALAQIIAIEKQLPQYVAPKNVYQIFQLFNAKQATQDEPISFVRSATWGTPDRETASRVHGQMREILTLVTENRAAIPPQYLPQVNRFEQYMQQYDNFEAGETSSRPHGGESLTSTQFPTVQDVKDTMKKPFRPFWTNKTVSLMYFPSFHLPLGIGLVIATAVCTGLGLFISMVGLGLGLGFGIPLILVGVAGLALVLDKFRHRKIDENAFANARTHKQIVPLFSELTVDAQARLFVELGPEFRAELCEWHEKNTHDTGMRQLADIVDTLQDGAAPAEYKRQAFQSLPLQKLKLDIYEFQNQTLQKLLIEKGLTGGAIVLPQKK